MSAPGSVPEFANPLPSGLVALAMVCFGFFALFTGQVSPACVPILAVWLMGGFLIQIIVAWIEFKEKNNNGSNLFLIFSVIFMGVGGGSALMKYFLKSAGLPFDPTIEGWLWIAPAIWVWVMTIGFLKAPKSLFILGIFLCAALPFLIALDMGLQGDRKFWALFIGYDLLVAACIATYIASATTLNLGFGKQILPLGAPIIK